MLNFRALRRRPSGDVRDRALDCFWSLPDDVFEEVVMPLLPPNVRRKWARQRTAIKHAVAAGLMGHREGLWTSYSRTHDWYADLPRYGGNEAMTCHLITGALEALEWADMIEHERSLPGQRGRQSRYRLKDWIVDRLQCRLTYHGRPELMVRDSERTNMSFAETDETRVMAERVRELRGWMRDLTFNLDPEWCTPDGPHHFRVRSVDTDGNARIGKDGKPTVTVVRQDPRVDIYRVFSRGSFHLGGRWYWWGQQLPSFVRQNGLKINGQEVCELDFSNMHIKQCYAIKGLDYEGDCYEAVEAEGFPRRHVKPAMMVNINAMTERQGIKATAWKIREPGKPLPDKAYVGALIAAIKRAHAAIADRFCSDAGLGLMVDEAEIAEAVMLRCKSESFEFCLPVHDSFICPVDRKEDLRRIMSECWREWAGRFKVDPESVTMEEPVVTELPVAAKDDATVSDATDNRLLHDPTRVDTPASLSGIPAVCPWVEGLVLRFGERVREVARVFKDRDYRQWGWISPEAVTPQQVQRAWGTRGMDLCGLPYVRTWEERIHDAWGRDRFYNPIDEETLERFRPKERRKAPRAARRVVPVRKADSLAAGILRAFPGAVLVGREAQAA